MESCIVQYLVGWLVARVRSGGASGIFVLELRKKIADRSIRPNFHTAFLLQPINKQGSFAW